jgi:hypothetical protein
MATLTPANDHVRDSESDYGSDFSAGEEGIVVKLLEKLQNTRTEAVDPIHTGLPLHADQVGSFPLKYRGYENASVFGSESSHDVTRSSQNAGGHASVQLGNLSAQTAVAEQPQSSSLQDVLVHSNC